MIVDRHVNTDIVCTVKRRTDRKRVKQAVGRLFIYTAQCIGVDAVLLRCHEKKLLIIYTEAEKLTKAHANVLTATAVLSTDRNSQFTCHILFLLEVMMLTNSF